MKAMYLSDSFPTGRVNPTSESLVVKAVREFQFMLPRQQRRFRLVTLIGHDLMIDAV